MAETRSFWDFKGADSYVDGLFMMGNPFPVLVIWVTYIFFVLKCGPKFMENRPAYKMRNVLLVYNAFQVALSCYIFKYGFEAALEHGLVERGYCFDELRDEFRHKLFYGTHVYFLAKGTELLDTVFFVLRKKYDQVTFLHVYHHSFMFVGTWMFLKYGPSYTFAFLGTINSFVHVIMYTYYGLSAFPKLAKYLWWKKYITKLQLIQFMLVQIQVLWNYAVSSCPPAYSMLFVTIIHIILFMYLFLDFYVKSYTSKIIVNTEDELRKEL